MGHPSDSYFYMAHKFIDGVPQFKHQDLILEQCPTFIHSDQPKTPGTSTTLSATRPFQGFLIEFSFSDQTSKDTKPCTNFIGICRKMCWVLINLCLWR